MEIKLKGRNIPRNAQGDAEFTSLVGDDENCGPRADPNDKAAILNVFTCAEIVELVNRALYQLEYQREAHKKRGAEQRAKEKALREALKKQGMDPKAERVQKELKGE